MPVIVNAAEPHPFLPSLTDLEAIEAERAQHQDIRPLQIAMINLMADKIAQERQLARWLGNSVLQVQLTFAATNEYMDRVNEGYQSRHTPSEHIRKFYKPFRDIKSEKFDGLIITGVNALEPDITKEAIWPHVKEILEWSETNVLSTLFLCWAGQAAMKHFYGIERKRQPRKTYGVFDHELMGDKTGVLHGFPDIIAMPVSRWNEIDIEDVRQNPALEVSAYSPQAGLSIVTEPVAYDNGHHNYPRRIFIFSHPEYDTDTLKTEYLRDAANDPEYPPPYNYFPNGDINHAPYNKWRLTGHIYTNWISTLYKASPYDLAQVPYAFGNGPTK